MSKITRSYNVQIEPNADGSKLLCTINGKSAGNVRLRFYKDDFRLVYRCYGMQSPRQLARYYGVEPKEPLMELLESFGISKLMGLVVRHHSAFHI
jgi:hypothetical protein